MGINDIAKVTIKTGYHVHVVYNGIGSGVKHEWVWGWCWTYKVADIGDSKYEL